MKTSTTRRVLLDSPAFALLVLLLAFALRVFHLGTNAIWWDESLSLYRATQDLATIFANTIQIQTVLTTDLQPPLYFLILHFLVAAFGTSEFALRFLSVVANTGSVALLYVLGRRWFSRTVGLLAAFLGAMSPFWVWYAQEARPYALVLFWSLLSIYALVRAMSLRSKELREQKEMRESAVSISSLISFCSLHAWKLTYVVAAIAALFTNYYAVFLFPFHALYIFLQTRSLKKTFLPVLPALSAIFLLPIIMRGAAGNVNSGPSFVPLDIILGDLVHSFSLGITYDASWLDAVMLLLFVIGVVFPISKIPYRAVISSAARNLSNAPKRFLVAKDTPRNDKVNYVLRFTILAFLLIPTLTIFFASYLRPLYQNSRYLIAWSPAYYLGVALGIHSLSRLHRHCNARTSVPEAKRSGSAVQVSRAFAPFAFLFFLFAAILSLNNLYFDPRYAKDDHRAWAESLRERARAGDYLILDSPHAEELFNYYARGVVPYATLPFLADSGAMGDAPDRVAVREALALNPRVWFLSMHVPFDDPDARIEKLLNEEGILLDRAQFRGSSTEIALSQYMQRLPTVSASEIMVPLNYAIDSHLRLVGIEPKTNAQDTRVLVKLYWQLDEPVGEDYGVSLRLLDGNARIAQWDSIILGNRAGTSTWPIKKIIVDEHDIPIAAGTPRSTYNLEVQVYHSATGNGIGNTIVMFDAIWLR